MTISFTFHIAEQSSIIAINVFRIVHINIGNAMSVSIEMSAENRGCISYGSPVTPIFIEIPVSQANRYPLLVFATIEVDIRGKTEIQSSCVIAFVNDISQISQMICRFKQKRVVLRSCATGPNLSSSIPNTGLGYGH